MAQATKKTSAENNIMDFDAIHRKGGVQEETEGSWEMIDFNEDGMVEAAFYFKPDGEAHKESLTVFWTARQARQIAYTLLMYANQAEE